MLKPKDVDYVIYHYPCLDGLSSALVVDKYMSSKDIIYKPMNIKGEIPLDIDGRNILICDYCFSIEKMLEIIKRANNVLVIDHHITAEKDLMGLDPKYKIFDRQHSGAVLTWKYFYPNTEIPLFLQYIEDHDIWNNKLPKTRQFNAFMKTCPLTLEAFRCYLDDETNVYYAIESGESFSQLNNFYIQDAVDWVAPKFSKIGNKFYIIGYLNTTILKSEIANQILIKYPNLDFSVAYSIENKTNKTAFSLRSTKTHVDVSKIAKKFNGGGHRNASAVKLEYICHALPGTVYDCGDILDLLQKTYFFIKKIPKIDILKLEEDSEESEEDDDYQINVIYLYTQYNKRRLGSYLLQTKFKEGKNYDGQRHQVGTSLLDCDVVPTYIHIAALWYYDPAENKSNYTITFDKKLDPSLKRTILVYFKDYHLEYEPHSNVCTVQYEGCQQTIL